MTQLNLLPLPAELALHNLHVIKQISQVSNEKLYQAHIQEHAHYIRMQKLKLLRTSMQLPEHANEQNMGIKTGE